MNGIMQDVFLVLCLEGLVSFFDWLVGVGNSWNASILKFVVGWRTTKVQKSVHTESESREEQKLKYNIRNTHYHSLIK